MSHPPPPCIECVAFHSWNVLPQWIDARLPASISPLLLHLSAHPLTRTPDRLSPSLLLTPSTPLPLMQLPQSLFPSLLREVLIWGPLLPGPPFGFLILAPWVLWPQILLAPILPRGSLPDHLDSLVFGIPWNWEEGEMAHPQGHLCHCHPPHTISQGCFNCGFVALAKNWSIWPLCPVPTQQLCNLMNCSEPHGQHRKGGPGM